MGFEYRCDKCHTLTDRQIILCPTCALKSGELGQPAHNSQRDAIAAFHKWSTSDKYQSTVAAAFMFGYAAATAPV